MKNVDVAVVGGSFAGLACARRAAAAGLRVAVLDGKKEPGENVRTTGIFVHEAALEWPLPAHLARRIGGARVYSPSLRWIDLDRAGKTFWATDTPGVMRWLAARAEAAGAETFWGRTYTGARRVDGGFVLDGAEVRCRFLVGADGAFSRVARDFGLGRNRRFLFGVEAEWEGVGGVDAERLHCFLTPRFAPGYIGWVVPGVKRFQIGLAGTAPFQPRLAGFVEHLSSIFDFRAARLLERRAGWIPVGGPVKATAPGVLLLGDAAGRVSPLTAGGIRLALNDGEAAGAAIAAHLAGAPPPSPAPGDAGLWAKTFLRKTYEWAMTERTAETFLSAALFRRAATKVLF